MLMEVYLYAHLFLFDSLYFIMLIICWRREGWDENKKKKKREKKKILNSEVKPPEADEVCITPIATYRHVLNTAPHPSC